LSTDRTSVVSPASPDLSRLRVLIVHEWLYAWAGAERCLEQMLDVFPNADLLVGVVTPRMRIFNDIGRRARESWVGRIPGARQRHRWFLPLHALAFSMYDTSDYDLVISSSHAFEKFVRVSGRTKHICYCYTPPRFVWDMQHVYEAQISALERVVLSLAAPVIRFSDRRAARRVHRFVSISRHVADRVRRSYGRESDVVYPPVSTKSMDPTSKPEPTEPFLLFIGRLVEYKRVDLLLRAAEQLRIKAVIAGDGPHRSALERIAGPHAVFLGEVSEVHAANLLVSCAVFVLPGEEDFGIAPVEANAHGRPVVCLSRGGCAETMIRGKTAIMFDEQSDWAVAGAIQDCLRHAWDPVVLKRNAARFSPDQFRSGLRRVVAEVLK
jgi:glycosyltransferase involved in cell wall biosynthesis